MSCGITWSRLCNHSTKIKTRESCHLCDIVEFLCRSDQIKLTLFGGNRNTRKGSLSVKNVPIELINITLLNGQEEEEEE